MKSRVQFEDEADAEYRLAGRWYEERRENLGIEFLDAVDATIDQILEWPDAGSAAPKVSPELRVRRRAVTRFPYHVIYVETSAAIRILAIAHDGRRPGYWRSRLR